MNDQNNQKYAIWIVVTIILIAFTFLGVRQYYLDKEVKSYSPEIKVEYKHGTEIHDTILNPRPYAVYRDTGSIKYYPKDIIKDIHDTIYIDTSKVVNDYFLTRNYSETLFDNDSLGKLVINSKVKFNKLSDYSYSFTPIHKVTTITNTKLIKRISPFIGIGLGTNNTFNALGGVFLKDGFGFAVGYNRWINDNQNSYQVYILKRW